MKDQRLLASAALFRELYDNDKDIYDVISEFIRASILLNSNWSFNATECAQDLEQTFGFQIPEAVIQTCLKNRLKRSGELNFQGGIYSVTEKLDRSKSIQPEYDKSKNDYKEITGKLVRYARNNFSHEFDCDEESKLISDFDDYLLDPKKTSDYAAHISRFLLINQDDETFKLKLNRIEEGLVLYAGIKYSSDLSTLGRWTGNLEVYLDVELLLSAAGYNGILYKKIFDDFNSLVKDVNRSKRKGGSVTLRYFEDTKREIKNFFCAAENIVENRTQVEPFKTAMLDIVNGCKSKSDVVAKKASFFDKLRILKVEIENSKNYYNNLKYNVEGFEVIKGLRGEFNHRAEDSKYGDVLKIFTKINNIREGDSNTGLERVAAIFMSENGLTQRIAFSDTVRPDKSSIPYCTNIEFLTERLWFKLNKGFGGGESTPVSFDVITKAKLVLSSQVHNVVSGIYRDMKSRYDQGIITKEEASLLLSELRDRPVNPEDFTIESIDDSFEFLNQNFIEGVLRERTILEKTSKEGACAVKKLRKIEHQKHIDKVKPFKRIARRQCRLLVFLFYIMLPIFSLSLLSRIYISADTPLSLVFGAVTVGGGILTLVTTKARTINSYMWSLSKKYYRNKLIGINGNS